MKLISDFLSASRRRQAVRDIAALTPAQRRDIGIDQDHIGEVAAGLTESAAARMRRPEPDALLFKGALFQHVAWPRAHRS